MHEMALTEGILRIIENQAAAQDFSKVKTVWLEIGALSTVEPEALAFCFDAVTRGSIAEGAKLEIVPIPGQAWCMICSETVTIAARTDPCPKCGGWQLQVTGGEDMRIREMEVE